MTRDLQKFVRRYTSLSSALDTLSKQRLFLLNPSKWDDLNDVYFMELYRSKAEVGSVLALCCTTASETYHHWRVFTQGMDGVCLEFARSALESELRSVPNMECGRVEYLRVKDLDALGPDAVSRLPFIKREGFSDEREWRIVLSSSQELHMVEPIRIQIASLNKIILNPWMPPSLADNL